MDINHFRRVWAPAIEAAGIRTPRGSTTCARRSRPTRSMQASDLHAGPDHGPSVRMIERRYGALLDGAGAGIADVLDGLDEERDLKGNTHGDTERTRGVDRSSAGPE
jgi:hypothetical protein